jgi:hypothetical protein
MVEKCGMPHLFLILNTDEISSLRWQEVTDIEAIAKRLENSFTWKDCHMECTTLFHTRVTKFMNEIILSKTGALGRVKDYLIRYELQHCGSLHAHIILWIEDNDVERVTNEITAVIPASYDDEKKEFIEPTDDL